MDDRINTWLYDVLKAIEEIDSFFDDDKRDFLAYKSDLKLKRAVERELEIIGEAINRIIKKEPSFIDKIEDALNIVGLRNQVIHAYDNVSDENIWAVVINHPQLKKDATSLIEE